MFRRDDEEEQPVRRKRTRVQPWKGFHNHRRTCPKKRRFRREYDAQKMITTLKRRPEYDGLPIRAYECTACHGWHIGHYEIFEEEHGS